MTYLLPYRSHATDVEHELSSGALSDSCRAFKLYDTFFTLLHFHANGSDILPPPYLQAHYGALYVFVYLPCLWL